MRSRALKLMFASMLFTMMVITMMPMGVFATDSDGESEQVLQVDSWDALQQAINTSNGMTIQLKKDIEANGKSYLNVSGKTVKIDLNGKELDRERTKSDSNGHVLWVHNNGSLTIVDSAGGGKITGGWANNGGVCLLYDHRGRGHAGI